MDQGAHADCSGVPEEPMAEQLIGLDEAHADDPLSQVMILQKRLQLLREEGDAVLKKQQKVASRVEATPADHVAIAAGIEQCRQHFLALREVSQKMISQGVDVFSEKACEDAAHDLVTRVYRHDPEEASQL